MRKVILAIIVFGILAPFAAAQIEVGAGYSQLKLAGTDNNLKDTDGFGFNLRASVPILPIIFDPLRVGVDLGWQQYVATGSGTSASDPDTSDLNLFNGDVRVAFRQPFGVFFIEPSISAGVLVGVYSTHNTFNLSSFEQTATGWSIRPGLAAGVHLAIFTAGVEASYSWGKLDFQNGAGGDLHEFYGGVFAGISF